jgi:hypothetical protein
MSADVPSHPLSRRRLLKQLSCGFGYLALTGLCAQSASAAAPVITNPLSARPPMLPARAKRVIFLFMQGGPSQVDTFDPKPALQRYDNTDAEFNVARTRQVETRRLLGSPWKFAQHGRCGRWASELFPHIARHVDDLCFVRSVHTEGVAHGPATIMLHTGASSLVRPSVGAWVAYGLGTANQDLPGFVTINPPVNMGGPRPYSNAFLPTVYQGTTVGRAGMPMPKAGFRHLTADHVAPDEHRGRFDLLRALNREQSSRLAGAATDHELEATIESFELAYRMQAQAPQLTDVTSFPGESPATLGLYGIGAQPTDEFGRQCLLARRLAEAGVRYIQVNYSDNGNNPKWDQHSNLKQHEHHARATDKPVAGLLSDLKARGLLEDTLVWWGGEFGRTPFAENRDGRDHNPNGFTIFLAGGGVKPGHSHGETDEFGYNAVTDKVHMHDLHATVLHLLGLDHEKLTYRYAGRDFRLTDVYGNVVRDIIA